MQWKPRGGRGERSPAGVSITYTGLASHLGSTLLEERNCPQPYRVLSSAKEPCAGPERGIGMECVVPAIPSTAQTGPINAALKTVSFLGSGSRPLSQQLSSLH